MNRRSKHLSSEGRGVIFAEHDRSRSQLATSRLLCRPAGTIGQKLARGRQEGRSDCPTAGRQVYASRLVALRRSITYDSGSEMDYHRKPARRINIGIWHCHPPSPWQRGNNENISNLLRQFMPNWF